MAKQLFPDGTEVAGFYVRTIKSGPFVFVSGTTSLDSKGRVRGKDAGRQTEITMAKVAAGLKSAGSVTWCGSRSMSRTSEICGRCRRRWPGA